MQAKTKAILMAGINKKSARLVVNTQNIVLGFCCHKYFVKTSFKKKRAFIFHLKPTWWLHISIASLFSYVQIFYTGRKYVLMLYSYHTV